MSQATIRVANLLRRNDIDNEIQLWLNYALTELTDQVKLPELRKVATPINLIPFTGVNNAVTTTGNVTLNSSVLTNLGTTNGIFVGASVTGNGIPAGSTVTAIGVGQVNISTLATGTFTGATINFGAMTSDFQAAQSYAYPFAAADYDSMSSIYYTDMTLTPTRGWNLRPFPREFFKGDTVDFERVLHRGNPGVGDPIYYFVDLSGGININGTLTTAGVPTIIIFPAFITPKVGTITPTYNAIPPDWTNPTSLAPIANRWHHYLIWIAYFYGMTMIAKDDTSIQPVAYWKGKMDEVINEVKLRAQRTEDRSLVYNLPGIGMDFADKHY